MSETDGPRRFLELVEAIVEVSEQTGPIGSPEEDVACRELERRLRALCDIDLLVGTSFCELVSESIVGEAKRRLRERDVPT